MKIAGLQKLTMLDYPSKLACIIFTQGCNLRCSYCQNSSLIKIKGDVEIPEEEIFEFLESRKKYLDGVVITGGEPTIHKDLPEFIKKIKDLGYSVKLDTNGTNPVMLKELIKKKLVDYVAMDVKNVLNEYENVVKVKINIGSIKKSISLLKQGKVKHEFRMTIIKNIHDIFKIVEVQELIGKDEVLFLQNFEDSEDVLDKTLESFSKAELINIQKELKERFPNTIVRGL